MSRVVLRNVPTRDVVAMIEHLDDVIRELALISTGANSGVAVATVPEPVLLTMDRVRPVLFAQKENISRQAGRAWRTGAPSVDVEVDLPAAAAPTLLEVLEVLEAVDDAAAGDGALLLTATSPDIAEFRRWFFSRLSQDLSAAPPSGEV